MLQKAFYGEGLKSLLILTLLVSLFAGSTALAQEKCPAEDPGEQVCVQNPPRPSTCSDCVTYDLSTQTVVAEYRNGPTFDARWFAGLNWNADIEILQGKIIAYQIQWFDGNWSCWFVPGVNDLDIKYNTSNNTMRRMWSYFYDHNHRFILAERP